MSQKVANPYLKEFELQRVLALIGYLATHRNANGVQPEIADEELSFPGPNPPAKGQSWLSVVQSHPDFFSVNMEHKEPALRLLERQSQVDTSRPRLAPDDVRVLKEIALKLHEAAYRREDQRSKWRDLIVTSVVALLVGAMGSDLIIGWIRGMMTR